MPIILDGTLGITTPALTVTGATVNTGGISTAGNLTFTSTGQRIIGDMSSTPHINRLAFQTSVTNGATSPFFIPNGTGTSSSIVVANASDPTNCSYGQIRVGTSSVDLLSGLIGTGTNLPMTFYTGGSERMRISTAGLVGIGTSSPAQNFVVSNGGAEGMEVIPAVNAGESRIQSYNRSGAAWNKFSINCSTYELFVNGATSAMAVNTSGNVGIGTTTPTNYGAGYKTLAINGTSSGILELQANGVAQSILVADASDLQIQALGARPVRFFTNGNERMSIDSSGLVSIGTNTATFGTLNVQRYASAPYATLTIQDYATPANTVGLYLRQNGSSPAGISTAGAPLAFFNGGAGSNEAMRIDASGNVGIGTSSPSYKLDVSSTSGMRLSVATGGYNWMNLVSGYTGNLSIGLNDNGGSGALRIAQYNSSGAFVRAAFEINSSGYITAPSQPMFIANGNQSTYVSVANGALIPCNTTKVNTSSSYNTSTYTFTAPVAGRYLFIMSFYMQGGTGVSLFDFQYNSATYQRMYWQVPAGDQSYFGQCIMNMAAGDTARVINSTGGARSMFIAGDLHTAFSGYLIG